MDDAEKVEIQTVEKVYLQEPKPQNPTRQVNAPTAYHRL